MSERIRCLVCDGSGYHIIGHLDAVTGPDDPIPTEKIDCRYCNGTGYHVLRDRKFDQVKKMSVSDLAMAAAEETITLSISALRCFGIELSETRRKVMVHRAYHHYLQLLQMPAEEEPHED